MSAASSAPLKTLYHAIGGIPTHQTAGKPVRPTVAGSYRAAAPDRTRAKLLALLHQVELLEEEWLGNDTGVDTPLLLSLAVNADSLATWLLPALKPVLADSPFA